MITLAYQTCNRRWGWSGMRFSNWLSFARVLGYLSNISHYIINNGPIRIVVEANDLQGADAEEGRIQYYGSDYFLQSNHPDLDNCSSAGVGNITCRINSNDYIISLIQDFDFYISSRINQLTKDIYPPQNGQITLNNLVHYISLNYPNENINDITSEYNTGWNL